MARLEIGWENKGEKAAGATTMGVPRSRVHPGIPVDRQVAGCHTVLDGQRLRGRSRYKAGARRRLGEHRDTVREARLRRRALRWVSFRIEPGMIDLA